jgi:hypothetical protein
MYREEGLAGLKPGGYTRKRKAPVFPVRTGTQKTRKTGHYEEDYD